MRTKQVNIADLKLAKYNPRQISDHDMASLVNSIREFGFVEPIVVNKNNTVIGGHQRIIAAKQLSMDRLPVVYVDLSKKKEKILNLALNRVHGEWDMGKLSIVLEELKMDNGDDLSLTGFELGEISEIIDSQIETNGDEDNFDAEAVAGQIKKPESKRGEVYQLGRHRLMCGDATCKDDVDKLMDGQKADMVFTDPPYNVGKGYAGEKLKEKEFQEFHQSWFAILIKLVRNCTPFYVFFGVSHLFEMCDIVRQFLINPRLLIWYKPDSHGTGGGDYFFNYEPIFYGSRSGKLAVKHYDGDFNRDVWIINKAKASEGGFEHPTVKPLQLCLTAIKTSSEEKDMVADLFGGSGTTLIAAEKTGRICYMMEIDEIYCDVIRKRYEEYVGQKETK